MGRYFPLVLVSEVAVGLSNENPAVEMAQPPGSRHIVDPRHHATAREVVTEIVKLNVTKARES